MVLWRKSSSWRTDERLVGQIRHRVDGEYSHRQERCTQDALGHRAIAQGAPGYRPVVNAFGNWILAPDGQIDRARLAKVVFSDLAALEQLEAIVHPLVGQAVDLLVRRARQEVIVLEAIKLLESGLRDKCDSLWVTHSSQDIQLARLMHKRRMSEVAARQRIMAQPDQKIKVNQADVVIHNDSSFEDTWQQVLAAWQQLFPVAETNPLHAVQTIKGEMAVQRARPRQADEIASFINQIGDSKHSVNYDDIMAAFGEKAFLLLKIDSRIAGLVGWQVENLVARTDEVYLEPQVPFAEAVQVLVGEIERASRELQCEISLLFLPPTLARQYAIWNTLGYQTRSVNSLGVRAWQEAAIESMPEGTVMLFKQLRKDRVLRPV
ncbi:MAG: dephospho-CoA kinase [Anaerolineales bacterium]